MARKTAKTLFVCQSCGYESAKWMGRCTECGAWDSFAEEVRRPAAARSSMAEKGNRPVPIDAVEIIDEQRMSTGIDEFDRVLGGGLVTGTLVLIGQPAEERISGARRMLEDGLYERFPKPDYALAFHVSADGPAGKVTVPLDVVASSSDSVDIVVHGVGAHGASPHRGVDPVLVAAQIVVSLQSLVSRTISPLESGVITVGAISGGTKHNIIGDRVEMQLTVRSDDAEVREALLDGIDRVAAGTAVALGVPEELMPEVVRSPVETTPPTINDAATARRVLEAIGGGMGEEALYAEPRKGMGAEDFAYFVQPERGVKGVYFAVGGTPADELGTQPSHHSPFFKVAPGPSIRSGVEASVLAAMALFGE